MSVYYRNHHERAFGTFPLKGSDAQAAVETAIDVGYRAIDTAQMYQNEEAVGAGIRAAGLPREDLCITTKVTPHNFDPADFLPSVEESLTKLGVDTVDVLLLHWPPADGDVAPSLKLLDQAWQRGMARHVGVSNYTIAMLKTAIDTIEPDLATNQVEFHPLLDQSRLLAGAAELGVPLSSYCSIARGKIFDDPDFAAIGETYGKTAGQVALRWILQKGVSINTKASSRDRMKANFEVMDFTLSNVDMARIDAKTALGHRIVDAGVSPWVPAWD